MTDEQPKPVEEPGEWKRTDLWCGECGCQLYTRPGGPYECRVCGWTGEMF